MRQPSAKYSAYMQVEAYPGETEEVGVTVRTALRTVDFVQVLEREVELHSEFLNTRAELASRKRRELVEERLDDSGVQDHH